MLDQTRISSKTIYYGNFGRVELTFESFYDNGRLLDTKVKFNGMELLTIAGQDIDAFTGDLKALIDKYFL